MGNFGKTMKKKAILVKGPRNPILDSEDIYDHNHDSNLAVALEIFNGEGYGTQETPFDEFREHLERLPLSDYLAFYFTGHSNKDYMGSKEHRLNDILKSIGLKGERCLAILDSCSGTNSRDGRIDFDSRDLSHLVLPQGLTLIGSPKLTASRSVIKAVWDMKNIYGISLDEINQDDFHTRGYDWIYVRKN